MVQRCTNPHHPKFAIYGGRGIAFAEHWQDFAAFLADMGERPIGHTLDRIDNDGPYSPDNCRWATPRMQQNNQSRTTLVNYQGEQVCLSDLAVRLGLGKATLLYRVQAGWPESDWANTPWGGHRH